MTKYDVRAFTVQLVRAQTGTVTVGDGGDSAQDLWALPNPRDAVLEYLGLDTTFQEEIADASAASIRALAQNVVRYALSGALTTAEEPVREGHEWNGDAWVDVGGDSNKFAFVFELSFADGDDGDLVFHTAGLGDDSVAAVVQYCIAVQGTAVA